MNPVQAFENALLVDRVARRASSSTPTLDKLYNDEHRIMMVLDREGQALHKAADKINGDPSDKLRDSAIRMAYRVFNPFRDFIGAWRQELSSLPEDTERRVFAKITAEVRNLGEALQSLNKNYALAQQVKQDKTSAAKVIHDLAVDVSTLNTVFKQYVGAYRGLGR